MMASRINGLVQNDEVLDLKAGQGISVGFSSTIGSSDNSQPTRTSSNHVEKPQIPKDPERK
jgi:hypothetical protein